MSIEIELKDEQVELMPERALFWPRMSTLFVADTHWGKDAAFRASSVAIPGGVMADDLRRLAQALGRTKAQRLILLGDLFHARKGRVPHVQAMIVAWREQFTQLDILLIRGNHDRKAGDPPTEWRMACVDAPCTVAPFVLQHEPVESKEGYALAGHLHPGVRLVGAGRQEMTLPCFWFGPRVAVLPAFGSFTGLSVVTPRLGDNVFVIVEDQIIDVI